MPQPSVSIPALSEEYRAESANVLKAVLASAPPSNEQAEAVQSIAAQRRRSSGHAGSNPTTITSAEMAHMTFPAHQPSSTGDLTSLHHSLTSLTRAQQEILAFSLTPAQYASITGMDTTSDHRSPSISTPTNHQHDPTMQSQSYNQGLHQTPLQKAFATMKKSQDQLDRSLMPQAWDRSAAAVMWDQVPEKVLRDFKKMVEEATTFAVPSQRSFFTLLSFPIRSTSSRLRTAWINPPTLTPTISH